MKKTGLNRTLEQKRGIEKLKASSKKFFFSKQFRVH
jgi:hypothetical protein